jgi:FkbM family methyltransferase
MLEMTKYSCTTLRFGPSSRQLYFREKSSDEAVMKQIFVHQQYNLNRFARYGELMRFGKRQEERGLRPLVVDAGANIGVSAVYFIGNLPSAHIVAIEPDLENFNLLSKNVDGLDVDTIRGAASSTKGKARVVDPGRGHWAYRTQALAENADFEDAVPRITINDVYESCRSKFFPFIVKVDIEGAEEDLFSGATEWVAATPILIVELHDWLIPKAGKAKPFLQCIATLDRDFISIGEDVFSIANDLEAFSPRDRC